jgi:hypothetical protein
LALTSSHVNSDGDCHWYSQSHQMPEFAGELVVDLVGGQAARAPERSAGADARSGEQKRGLHLGQRRELVGRGARNLLEGSGRRPRA